jgi:GH24 family phage-related lysozyme (muramidase)
MTGCANQFLAWDKINDVSNQGLLNRRRAERALFLGH